MRPSESGIFDAMHRECSGYCADDAGVVWGEGSGVDGGEGLFEFPGAEGGDRGGKFAGFGVFTGSGADGACGFGE